MDWRQLQEALARFIAYAAERDPGAGDLGAWDEEHVEALRAEVKRNAANTQRKARIVRKEWHDKAMVPGKGAMLVGSACRACGKGPSPAGRPLKACAACHALHTGAERQRASWKDHKAVCRADAVNKKGMATDGVDAKRGSGHD